MKLTSFHVSACKGSAILLNPFINLRKNYMKPKNDCTCCMVVGFSHSLRLLTLASLIWSLSGVMSNPKKVVVHCRKLHFFRLQQNSYLHKHKNSSSNSSKCSSAMILYINMSSKITTTPLSSMSINKFFFFAWTLLVHLLDQWALQSIHIAHTRSKTLSLLFFLLLYSTTSKHCEDLVMWRTLHFPVDP